MGSVNVAAGVAAKQVLGFGREPVKCFEPAAPAIREFFPGRPGLADIVGEQGGGREPPTFKSRRRHLRGARQILPNVALRPRRVIECS